ncbi:MAG: hypothetical protein EXS31_06820 [Pedosphaera sp.]|nr:hypothetical protein [Pedosphaera sp.]
MKSKNKSSLAARACLGAAIVAVPSLLHGQSADSARLERLENENRELKQRFESLEHLATKEGIVPGQSGASSLKVLSESQLSGFVSASFFHDTSNPPGGVSPGYLWNRRSDSFSLNKVKLTLASPAVERSGDKFSAAYRASLIFGQDAPIVNSGSGMVGFENLREAYVEMNVPVGTGLNVKAGELISLLNYESGDGGAANDNFSQGYQWFYTGNGPAAGVQVGYTLTDWLDVKLRAQNGLYAGPIDNNDSKTGVIAFGIKPSDKVWLNLIGFTGREDAFSKMVHGGSLLSGWQINEKLHFGAELDYFNFRSAAKDSEVWSAGGWLSYAITDKVLPSVRVEFLSDKNGADISGDPLGFALNGGQDIASVAFTLNIKPVPNIKIQPEVRYDHTSLAKGFGTKTDRVVLGIGVSYLF